jgi:hypothetical protein
MNNYLRLCSYFEHNWVYVYRSEKYYEQNSVGELKHELIFTNLNGFKNNETEVNEIIKIHNLFIYFCKL